MSGSLINRLTEVCAVLVTWYGSRVESDSITLSVTKKDIFAQKRLQQIAMSMPRYYEDNSQNCKMKFIYDR